MAYSADAPAPSRTWHMLAVSRARSRLIQAPSRRRNRRVNGAPTSSESREHARSIDVAEIAAALQMETLVAVDMGLQYLGRRDDRTSRMENACVVRDVNERSRVREVS